MSESSLCDHGYVYGCPECLHERRGKGGAMKTIQERALALWQSLDTECIDFDAFRDRAYLTEDARPLIEAALRAQLDEIRAQVEGLEDSVCGRNLIERADVLTLLATLRGDAKP